MDAHLHPAWQHVIGSWLLSKFPKIQFIVATHSPFLAQVADEPGGNIILQEEHGRVTMNPTPPAVARWRVDQVLSEVFGLPDLWSPEVVRKLHRLAVLTGKDKSGTQTEDEKWEFEQLRRFADELRPPMSIPRNSGLFDRLSRAVLAKRDSLEELE